MQQLGEAPIISTATKAKTPEAATAQAVSAPWLQPAKTSSSATTQPWMMKQSVGAPGTTSAPCVQVPGPVTMGSTPATAFPPPVAPVGGYDYQVQGQDWGQHGWNGGYNSYYGSWNQSVQGAGQQAYGHLGPPAGGVDANAGTPGGASGTDQYQYASCSNPPQ